MSQNKNQNQNYQMSYNNNHVVSLMVLIKNINDRLWSQHIFNILKRNVEQNKPI